MGPLVALLAIVLLLLMLGFLKILPSFAKKKQVDTFNYMVMGVGVFFSLIVGLNIYTSYAGDAVNGPYAAQYASVVALAIADVWIVFCFLLRNFWLFKQKRPPGT